MKRKIFYSVLMLFLFYFLNAHKQEINKIRELYKNAQENIAAQINGEIPEDNIHVVLNQNMPALGPQNWNITKINPANIIILCFL